MAITDNWGYVKQAVAGLLGVLMVQSAASAESKFLSLSFLLKEAKNIKVVFVWGVSGFADFVFD